MANWMAKTGSRYSQAVDILCAGLFSNADFKDNRQNVFGENITYTVVNLLVGNTIYNRNFSMNV